MTTPADAATDAHDRLEPVSPGSPYLPLRVAVLDRLRAAILDGSLAPGTLLSENRLAARLEVSRTPVREALRVLEREGLVEVQPGRKLVVSAPTARDIDDLYGIRMLIEPEAVRRIAPDDEALLARLDACVARGFEALAAGDRGAITEPQTDFHMTLVSALDNRRLEQFLDSIHDAVTRLRLYSLEDDAWAREAIEDHAALVALLRAGRADDAAAALREHLATAGAKLREKFDSRRRCTGDVAAATGGPR